MEHCWSTNASWWLALVSTVVIVSRSMGGMLRVVFRVIRGESLVELRLVLFREIRARPLQSVPIGLLAAFHFLHVVPFLSLRLGGPSLA